MNPALEIKSWPRKVTQIAVGENTELEDRYERYLDAAGHVHRSAAGPCCRYLQRKRDNLSHKTFTRSGADDTGLCLRIAVGVRCPADLLDIVHTPDHVGVWRVVGEICELCGGWGLRRLIKCRQVCGQQLHA